MGVARKMSNWGPLVVVVLATAAAAVVSVTSVPVSTAVMSTILPSNGPRIWHSAQAEPALPGQDGNRPAAVAEAHRLFGRIAVPSTWTPVASLPLTALETPPSIPGTTDVVDLYQDWTTPGSLQTVQSWVERSSTGGVPGHRQ